MGQAGRATVAGSLAALASTVVLAAPSAAGAGDASPPRGMPFWVELGPQRTVVARSVTELESCPGVVVDGRRRAMRLRAAPDPPDYPVRTCELSIPPDAESATLDRRRLPLPVARPERIAVLGDTGCRMHAPDAFQACNDPHQWPFRRVAESVAVWDPDLVIHVGDYHYRESPCPDDNPGCAGSPSGYNWATWHADFFAPARRALRAAPWLFLRGNHESCSRAGTGWFTFLDPRPLPPACGDFTAPWVSRSGDTRMVVLDSSSAADVPPLNPEPYAAQFAAMPRMAGRDAWLLSHRPLWGLASFQGTWHNTNETLQAASASSLPPSVELIVSGHLHQAEVLAFGPDRAPQIVAGQGGTSLDPEIPPPAEGTEVGGAPLESGEFLWRYGFLTFVRDGDGWAFKIRGAGGRSIADCTVSRSRPCPG